MNAMPLLLCALAFGLLGLATDAHHRNRFGRRPDARRCATMRTAAWVALAAGFVAAIVAQGWIFGPILWTATLMAGAALSFLALNLLPAPVEARHVRPSVKGITDAQSPSRRLPAEFPGRRARA